MANFTFPDATKNLSWPTILAELGKADPALLGKGWLQYVTDNHDVDFQHWSPEEAEVVRSLLCDFGAWLANTDHEFD